jgi:acetolactate synthase I/III small subunit
MSQKATGSAYFIEDKQVALEPHTFSILVDNEPGVLSRIAGLFSGRGYNIESLTVCETEHAKHLSRFTIVTRGTPMVLAQIKHQLERMVPVHSVVDLTVLGDPLERELALVKVAGKGEKRIEALRLAEIFRASSSKIEQFLSIMADLGMVEVSRTGIAAIGRGAQGMNQRDAALGT